jgi:hypothetical protein
VEDLLPKTKAIRVMLSISIPFSPAFPSPMMKAARKIKIHSVREYKEIMSIQFLRMAMYNF